MLQILHECNASNITLEDMPSDLVKMVRVSDPSIWPILFATNEIINTVDLPWQHIANDVGMIMVGNSYPKKYSKKVMTEVSTTGRVSPLSFINANAGAAISICCTTYKFQGPTINLTMSNLIREQIASVIAKQWLNNGDAKYIFLVTADFNGQDECVVNNKLISLNLN
ncbi:MAG: hypothetical protein WAW86_04430 [Gammaproteobacteria bacterium]